MRKVKYLLIGLAVAGMMTGCGKNADSEAVNGTEVQSTVEEMSSTAASEMTSEAAPTEITTEPVAQTSLPEEDEIYNYGMISGVLPQISVFEAYGSMIFAAKSSIPHLPYMTRFIILVRLLIPSTNPLFKGLATAFSTASISRSRPFAKLATGANSLFL